MKQPTVPAGATQSPTRRSHQHPAQGRAPRRGVEHSQAQLRDTAQPAHDARVSGRCPSVGGAPAPAMGGASGRWLTEAPYCHGAVATAAGPPRRMVLKGGTNSRRRCSVQASAANVPQTQAARLPSRGHYRSLTPATDVTLALRCLVPDPRLLGTGSGMGLRAAKGSHVVGRQSQ